MKRLFLIISILLVLPAASQLTSDPPRINHLRLDHVNIAVADLAAAQRFFQDTLGFSIKPGRRHANSIENCFIKFADGSQLELISAKQPDDALAAWYLRRIRQFPGGSGAFVCLRAQSEQQLGQLARRLKATGYPVIANDYRYARLISFPEDSPLHRLFFIWYRRPAADAPHLTTHANGAQSMQQVWLAADSSDAFHQSLAKISRVAGTPTDGAFAAFPLAGGRLYLNPTGNNDQRIAGLTIGVKDLSETHQYISQKLGINLPLHRHGQQQFFDLPAELCRGVRLRFLQL